MSDKPHVETRHPASRTRHNTRICHPERLFCAKDLAFGFGGHPERSRGICSFRLLHPDFGHLSHLTAPRLVQSIFCTLPLHLYNFVFTLECSPMAVARRLRAFVLIVSALLPLA